MERGDKGENKRRSSLPLSLHPVGFNRIFPELSQGFFVEDMMRTPSGRQLTAG